MSCETRCPNCAGLLEFSHDATHGRPMYRCAECSRWFMHKHEGAQCGFFGWVGTFPQRERFTPCEKQGSLAL